MSRLKGEVGEVRRDWSFERILEGKVVDFAAQRVLSLSRTRARIVGVRGVFSDDVEDEEMRCGPRFSGSCAKVGIVRCGRRWLGCLRRVCTVWLKARRLEFGEPAIVDYSW